jgi:hypothetical protein
MTTREDRGVLIFKYIHVYGRKVPVLKGDVGQRPKILLPVVVLH